MAVGILVDDEGYAHDAARAIELAGELADAQSRFALLGLVDILMPEDGFAGPQDLAIIRPEGIGIVRPKELVIGLSGHVLPLAKALIVRLPQM